MRNKIRSRSKILKKKLRRSHFLKKKLNLKDLPDKPGKKFLIIQIDGLSKKILEDLVRDRKMPFIRKMLHTYNLTGFNPGFPTTTPFVQAGIMYGENSNIPGYMFLDKKTQHKFAMALSTSARRIEEEIEKDNKGILRGGTSVSNLFTGGANRAILTASHLYKIKGKPKKSTDILFLILLNPLATLKVVSFSLYEFFLEIIESFKEILLFPFRKSKFNFPFIYPYMPFMRMFTNAIAREVATETTLLELDRNVPHIYLTFGGYDWASHYRGPRSLPSFGILYDIDLSIRRLVKKAEKKGYDIYVLSDHGQIDAEPFERKYHLSFEEFLEKVSNMDAKSIADGNDDRTSKVHFVGNKLRFYYEHASLPLRLLSGVVIKLFKKTFQNNKEKKINWNKKKQILALCSSSLSQVYFNYTKERLNLSQIEKNHPYFISRLVNHPSIGFIIGIEGKTVKVISNSGKVIITGKKAKFKGERFLQNYGDEKRLVKQIKVFANQKYSGDLIINGHFDGKRIITFNHYQYGSHDSIGGDQVDAFFISKEKIDLSKVINAKELNKIFERYHKKNK